MAKDGVQINMKSCISQNSVNRLRAFIEEYQPPWRSIADATYELKLGVRVSRTIIQRNTLNKMKKQGVAGKELTNRARGNICASRNMGSKSKPLRNEISSF